MFNPHDWVRIKYGECAGMCGKITASEKDGKYLVTIFGGVKDEDAPARAFLPENLELIPPFDVDREMLKAICKAKIIYSDFAEKVHPPFNLRASQDHRISIYDVRDAIINIRNRQDPISAFKEWFWLLSNIFYDNLRIFGYLKEGYLIDIPENETEVFLTVWRLAENLYWRLETRSVNMDAVEEYLVSFDNEPKWGGSPAEQEEEKIKEIFSNVLEDILARIKSYLYNRKLPEKERIYSVWQMKHFAQSIEDEDGLRGISDYNLKYYRKFINILGEQGDPYALRVLAWGHYSGNRVFRHNWELSRKYLLELYEKHGDPFAANSLGYISYYGRCSVGEPSYEEAFKYFSFAASAGIDEAVLKCSDMLLAGLGTPKNAEMALSMVMEGYRTSLSGFCAGAHENCFAEYAYRMGNFCRDGIAFGMGMRDAYKFYLEASFALKVRRRETLGSVKKDVDRELGKIRRSLKLNTKRTVLKADYPIYINQLYNDSYPLKVFISAKDGKYSLHVKRFRMEDELDDPLAFFEEILLVPKILVTYPELSYSNLVSELRFDLEGVSILKKPEKGDFFLSDGFHRNNATGALEFYADGVLAAVIKAEWFVIRVKK